MNVVIPDEGEIAILTLYIASADDEAPRFLKLFTNDITPSAATVVADFVEATFDGYAMVELDETEWSEPVISGGAALTQYGLVAQQWENEGASPQTVYGYYLTNDAGTVCLWAQRFNDPIEVEPAGTLTVLPVFTMKSKY